MEAGAEDFKKDEGTNEIKVNHTHTHNHDKGKEQKLI
jgi:hypothetical protein